MVLKKGQKRTKNRTLGDTNGLASHWGGGTINEKYGSTVYCCLLDSFKYWVKLDSNSGCVCRKRQYRLSGNWAGTRKAVSTSEGIQNGKQKYTNRSNTRNKQTDGKLLECFNWGTRRSGSWWWGYTAYIHKAIRQTRHRCVRHKVGERKTRIRLKHYQSITGNREADYTKTRLTNGSWQVPIYLSHNGL